MIKDRGRTDRLLHLIADALGIDVIDFWTEGDELRAENENLAILAAFDRIIDSTDRRSCIEFVEAAARAHETSA